MNRINFIQKNYNLSYINTIYEINQVSLKSNLRDISN